MRTHEPFDDSDLQALLENLPMSKHTPESLKSKLVDLASSPEPRHRAVRRPVFAFAFAGALAVAAVAAVLMSMPTTASAKTWAGIRKAVQGVTTMQMLIKDWDSPKGETTRIAFAPGTVLVQPDSGEIVFLSGNKVQIYEPGEKVVREFPMPVEMPNVKDIVLKELAMTKILAEMERENGKENIKIGPMRTWQGRRVYDATFLKPAKPGQQDEPEKGTIIVDAETDLPIFIETFKQVNGAWKKNSEITAHYNGAVDAKSLQPQWPAGVKFEKFDISKEIAEGMRQGGTPPPSDLEIEID